TKRQIERLVAELHPRPDVPSAMRRLPEGPAAPIPAEPSRDVVQGPVSDEPPTLVAEPPRLPVSVPVPVVEPLSPSRYKIQFTASEEFHDDVERLRALLRAEIPDGDLAAIVGKAVRELR